MDMTNLAVLLCGPKDIRIKEDKVPIPAKNEVVVHIKKCGICGTDAHLYVHGNCGSSHKITPENPFAIGHECSGIIHSIGEGITHLSPGDCVALELGVSCRNCSLCKQGKGNLCKPWSQGGLTQYLQHPADYCHKLPESVSLEEGALMEPLAVAVRACDRAGVSLGSKVLVCGAGTIGLCTLMVAKARGASRVCITDLSKWRLDLASSLGANCVVHVQRGESSQSISEKIVRALEGLPDFVVECCGAPSSVYAAFLAVKPGGVVTPVALDIEEVIVPMAMVLAKEVEIKGVFSYYGKDYPSAIALVASGQVKPSPVISHHFGMKDTEKAINFFVGNQDKALKCMIDLDSN